MISTSISRQSELPSILTRAQEALRGNLEYSAAVPNYLSHRGKPTAYLAIPLVRNYQLYVTQTYAAIENGKTIERKSYHWVPTPPEMLGSWALGDVLYVHGKEREDGWPVADVALRIRDTHLDRPGLVLGIGKTSLPNLEFMSNGDPSWATRYQFDTDKFMYGHTSSNQNIPPPTDCQAPGPMDFAAMAARRMAHALKQAD